MGEPLSAALQASRAKVDEAVSGMVDDIDRSLLRKMQKEMYLCSARCCDDQSYKMTDVQSCAERCSQPVQQGQNYIQQELNDFLDRLQRCGMECQDSIKDRVGSAGLAAGDPQTDRLKKEMEGCLLKCADKHLGLLPTISKRIKGNLQSIS